MKNLEIHYFDILLPQQNLSEWCLHLGSVSSRCMSKFLNIHFRGTKEKNSIKRFQFNLTDCDVSLYSLIKSF